jgi:hypothetical protein
MNAPSPVLVELDARGLEPPQPLIRILEALNTLPPDACLHARTDRQPIHLHPLLVQRGFVGVSHPLPSPDHGYLTEIRHRE